MAGRWLVLDLHILQLAKLAKASLRERRKSYSHVASHGIARFSVSIVGILELGHRTGTGDIKNVHGSLCPQLVKSPLRKTRRRCIKI